MSLSHSVASASWRHSAPGMHMFVGGMPCRVGACLLCYLLGCLCLVTRTGSSSIPGSSARNDEYDDYLRRTRGDSNRDDVLDAEELTPYAQSQIYHSSPVCVKMVQHLGSGRILQSGPSTLKVPGTAGPNQNTSRIQIQILSTVYCSKEVFKKIIECDFSGI